MSAAAVSAELHRLIVAHGLTVEGESLVQAVETTEFETTGEIELQFFGGEWFTVQIQGQS